MTSCSRNCSGATAVAPERVAVWHGEPARLDRVLPELGLARSRSRAAELVAAGRVRIGGALAAKAGIRVPAESVLTVAGEDHYVGRAAHKLVAGLDAFGVDPAGRVALDVGASTGGFTQVLLERGARAVQAIDVGHGQMAAEIAADPRVRLVEGRNARELTAENLAADTGIAEAPEIVVADLSFISITLVLPALAGVAAETADLVLLIKPQFEVGRVRDGVVASAAQRAEAITKVLASASESGLRTRGLEPSPISGGAGNREFLVYLTRGAAGDPAEWEGRIAELSSAAANEADETDETDEAGDAAHEGDR